MVDNTCFVVLIMPRVSVYFWCMYCKTHDNYFVEHCMNEFEAIDKLIIMSGDFR